VRHLAAPGPGEDDLLPTTPLLCKGAGQLILCVASSSSVSTQSASTSTGKHPSMLETDRPSDGRPDGRRAGRSGETDAVKTS
jgi:hypothetical protein